MARGINKVILIGNLGSDPDVRYMPNGNAVANISLATSDSWRDRETGQQHERTEWHRVVFFGKLAEIVGQYLRKGSKIYVEGRLQTREWEKDGIKRYSTEVIVDFNGQMQMLDGRGEGADFQGSGQTHQVAASGSTTTSQSAPSQAAQMPSQAGSAPMQQPQPQATVSQDAPAFDAFDDDEIPF